MTEMVERELQGDTDAAIPGSSYYPRDGEYRRKKLELLTLRNLDLISMKLNLRMSGDTC